MYTVQDGILARKLWLHKGCVWLAASENGGMDGTCWKGIIFFLFSLSYFTMHSNMFNNHRLSGELWQTKSILQQSSKERETILRYVKLIKSWGLRIFRGWHLSGLASKYYNIQFIVPRGHYYVGWYDGRLLFAAFPRHWSGDLTWCHSHCSS